MIKEKKKLNKLQPKALIGTLRNLIHHFSYILRNSTVIIYPKEKNGKH